MQRTGRNGFTLIELMIVVAVVAVLAAIAYPNYSRYAYRSRRAEGKEFLMRLAAAEEKYYGSCNKYAANIAAAATPCDNNLGISSATSEHGYYSVAVSGLGANNQTFTLTAKPVAASVQAGDAASCTTLTIDNRTAKNYTGSGNNGSCW
ncbi:type IV pilin protein [Rudaea sp.]|uniref:type IV pilin protein n=1 Tax=Rudaea sp. TaxID=2136325 RepID=UPI00321FEE98